MKNHSAVVASVVLALVASCPELGGADRSQSPQRDGSTIQQAATPVGQKPASRRTQRVVPLQEVHVASPNGTVEFTLLSNPERLTYTVSMAGHVVVRPSPLDMRVDGYHLSSGVTFSGLERFTIDETYPWHGAHRAAVNRCNGARVSLVHDLSMTPYILEIRAFDDGVAYRHVVAGGERDVRVPDEYSGFVLPAGSDVWFHDLDGHYEAEYAEREISAIPAGRWAGPPVTFQLPGGAGYGSIAEADVAGYAGMGLESDGRGGWIIGLGHRHPINYPYELRYGREEAKRLAAPASVSGTISTPWRVVMAGRDLGTLVNSDILPNLCPPADPKYFPQGMDTPWVRPGKAVWNYVERGGDNSLETMKDYARLGAQIGATYHILEGFAYGWPDEQIRDLVAYSKQQGIRLLFWRHSKELRTPEAQDAFFRRLRDLGVAGAKIDFFDHEAKELVDLYETLDRKAAENQLVVDFHGSNKPSGRLRTWPNEMLREGVRGMESRSVKERARHETILPFARYLAGPTDYTTMVFGERRGDSSWAHQIASLATFHSPMLTIAATPRSVLENPAIDLIKSIPPVWDETIVLPESRIGQLSVFARRSGEAWFLAIMSGTKGSTLRVPLSFLGPGRYRASIVRDNEANPASVAVEERTVERGDALSIQTIGGGGFLARFSK
jgi:alpha-glucosidase